MRFISKHRLKNDSIKVKKHFKKGPIDFYHKKKIFLVLLLTKESKKILKIKLGYPTVS